LARPDEGDLLKAYRLAMGYWTLEYVCDNSSSAGNYRNSSNWKLALEVSGTREVGDFKDGIYTGSYGFGSSGDQTYVIENKS